MPCGPRCACLGSDVECLSVLDPGRFGFFKDWCESGTEAQRKHVLNRSRIGPTSPPVTPPVAPESPVEQPLDEPGSYASPGPADARGMPCCGGKPPGLLAKAANFAKAALEHVAAGSPEADEPTASARLGTCLGCEHLDARAMTCNLCSCFMPRKVYWLEQRCPIGKW